MLGTNKNKDGNSTPIYQSMQTANLPAIPGLI